MIPPLPAGPYDLILADPPWDYVTYSDKGKGRGAVVHYDTLGIDAICALPVARSAARNAILLLWATFPHLPDALRVIEAWGFRYSTCAFTWVKVNADNSPAFGLGFYTRSNAEPCLLATRGEILPRMAGDVGQVLFSQRRAHSQKPDGQYDRIERLFGKDVRRLELFARRRWPGWDAWGNEAPVEDALMLALDGEAAG